MSGFRYDDYELNPKPDMLLQNANILNYQIKTTEDNALSLKIGYLNDIREGLTAFAHYAEGFKAPNYEHSNTKIGALKPSA
jgi:hemoglobin/transferrin/lactoferrin receptor protein